MTMIRLSDNDFLCMELRRGKKNYLHFSRAIINVMKAVIAIFIFNFELWNVAFFIRTIFIEHCTFIVQVSFILIISTFNLETIKISKKKPLLNGSVDFHTWNYPSPPKSLFSAPNYHKIYEEYSYANNKISPKWLWHKQNIIICDKKLERLTHPIECSMFFCNILAFIRIIVGEFTCTVHK